MEQDEIEFNIDEMLRALLEKGFTQEAIATGLKINQSTISRILAGKYCRFKFNLALEIQNLFVQHTR